MAMHESDGIAETFDDALRIAVTVGVRAAEHRARAREQQTRAAQAESEQADRAMQQRIKSERAAAVAQLEQVRRDDWWETASVDEIQHVWETAETWREIEPRAAEVSREIREQLQRRGIVPGEDGPAAAIDDSRRSELADAQVLASAGDRAEARDREDRETQAQPLPEAGVDVDVDVVAPADAVEARDLADVSQALPPEDAVARGAARAREKPARRGSHQRGIRRDERGL